jgi:FHA domain
MSAKSNEPEHPSAAELREILPTVTGFSAPGDPFATRLQYVSDLVIELGPQLSEPILAWREAGNAVRHVPTGRELVVGRQTGDVGLSLPGDDLLSRRHFVIRSDGPLGTLEDLHSRNGTAINTNDNRKNKTTLCDGDLIYAGRHIFVYLNPIRS